MFTFTFNFESTGEAVRTMFEDPLDNDDEFSRGIVLGSDESDLEEKIDVYNDTMPTFSTLSVIEEWRFVTDLSDYDVQRGQITGAVEVFPYDDTLLMYFKEEYVPGIISVIKMQSEDGLNWTNKTIVINETEDETYSHVYVTQDNNDYLHMFMQIKHDGYPMTIGHATSLDTTTFSTVDDFLDCGNAEGLFNDFFETYNCDSCAHGRIEALPNDDFLFTASATCEREMAESTIGSWSDSSYKPGMIIFYLDSNLNIDESKGIDYVPYCNDPTIASVQTVLGLERVSIYCDAVFDVGAISEYNGVDSGIGTVWDDSQFDPDGNLRLIFRIDSTNGYNFDLLNPGIVHFYDENDEWKSVIDYSLDDLDHAYAGGSSYLYSATNSVGTETSTVIVFTSR